MCFRVDSMLFQNLNGMPVHRAPHQRTQSSTTDTDVAMRQLLAKEKFGRRTATDIAYAYN